MDQREQIIPSMEELGRSFETADRSGIEFFFDVDLDELTALFYGPGREAFAHPINDMMSYLVDVNTNEVVGIVFSRFTQEVVRRVPETIDLVSDATIIMDDFLGPVERFFEDDPTLGGRIGATAGAVGDYWESFSDTQSIRDVMKGIRGSG